MTASRHTPAQRSSIADLERILALPGEALKIEMMPSGEIRSRTAEEWVPVALRLSADDWHKLPTETRHEVHALAASMLERKPTPEGLPNALTGKEIAHAVAESIGIPAEQVERLVNTMRGIGWNVVRATRSESVALGNVDNLAEIERLYVVQAYTALRDYAVSLERERTRLQRKLSTPSSAVERTFAVAASRWIDGAADLMRPIKRLLGGREDALRRQGDMGAADALKKLIDGAEELLMGVPMPNIFGINSDNVKSTLPITQCPDGQNCSSTTTGQCWGRCVRATVASSAIGTSYQAVGYVKSIDGCTSTHYERGRVPDGESMLYIVARSSATKNPADRKATDV